MLEKGRFVCYSCGGSVEHAQGMRPCEALSGWFMVSQWKGPGMAEHLYFCSLTCLKKWADAQAPDVPQAFLRAFEEQEDR